MPMMGPLCWCLGRQTLPGLTRAGVAYWKARSLFLDPGISSFFTSWELDLISLRSCNLGISGGSRSQIRPEQARDRAESHRMYHCTSLTAIDRTVIGDSMRITESQLRRIIKEALEEYEEPTRDEMRTEEFDSYTRGVWKIYQAIKSRVRGKHIVLMQLIKDPPEDVINAIDSMVMRARRNRDFDPILVRKFFRPGRVESDLRKMGEMDREFMVSISSTENVPSFRDDDESTPL